MDHVRVTKTSDTIIYEESNKHIKVKLPAYDGLFVVTTNGVTGLAAKFDLHVLLKGLGVTDADLPK